MLLGILSAIIRGICPESKTSRSHKGTVHMNTAPSESVPSSPPICEVLQRSLSPHTTPEESRPGLGVSTTASDESFNPDELLSFGAKQIISLFVPVTICMFFVVLVASTVDYYASTDQYLIYTPFHTPDADIGTRTWQTLANTLIFMSVIVLMTVFLVLLFKYRCYKFIHAWLVAVTFILLFLISFQFFSQVFRTLGIFVDYVTMVFILWNFGVVGMIVIHWRGPLILQQAYLIFLSAQIALMFLKYLPRWTCWVLLGALAIWDLIAVLCPRGPLRMLVEMAHERNQPLFPALLYSTTAAFLVANTTEQRASSNTNSDSTDTENPLNNPTAVSPILDQDPFGESSGASVPLLSDFDQRGPTSPQQSTQPNMDPSRPTCSDPGVPPTNGAVPVNQAASNSTNLWREVQADLRDREERGVKLGLGDFVFYSLLIGRATLDGDSITVATTYVAILVGMCVTIMVLGITRRALPALPISIACGILFYFVTSIVISPFLEALASQRLFF